MEKRERVYLFVWLIFSISFCIESWRLGVGSFQDPGSGFLPFGASLITGLLALALLLKGWGGRPVEYVAPFFQEKGARKVVYMVCLLFAYPLLMSGLGFFLCTLLFVGFSLKLIEPQKWRIVIGVSIGVAIISYLLFDMWMHVQLPKGRWMSQLLTVLGVFIWT